MICLHFYHVMVLTTSFICSLTILDRLQRHQACLLLLLVTLCLILAPIIHNWGSLALLFKVDCLYINLMEIWAHGALHHRLQMSIVTVRQCQCIGQGSMPHRMDFHNCISNHCIDHHLDSQCPLQCSSLCSIPVSMHPCQVALPTCLVQTCLIIHLRYYQPQ